MPASYLVVVLDLTRFAYLERDQAELAFFLQEMPCGFQASI